MSDRLKICPFHHPVHGDADSWADVVCHGEGDARAAAEQFALLPGPRKVYAWVANSPALRIVEEVLREHFADYAVFLDSDTRPMTAAWTVDTDGTKRGGGHG